MGDLRECEDENKIEEQLERFDGAVARIGLGDFCSQLFSSQFPTFAFNSSKKLRLAAPRFSSVAGLLEKRGGAGGVLWNPLAILGHDPKVGATQRRPTELPQ